MGKRRILVTAALPYANSELHIAHARSTYIPADIYVRYQRLNKNEVYYVCGSDEHGTPISIMAEKEKVTPIEIAEKYHKRDLEDFKRLGISFDNFSRTTRKIHYETTQWFFKTLYENGYIYEKKMSLPYCQKCKRFLPDRYVVGTCPYCGFEEARGDECDKCGRALSLGELINPKCSTCGGPAIEKESVHWFLKLSAFQDKLREWIENSDLLLTYGKSYILNQYVYPGLEDVCISRDLDWGVPIPLKEAEGKVCYVWFDAPIGYIDSTKELFINLGSPDKWKDFWLNSETELIHFIGKGILYHHTLFWPAMLMGCKYRLPTVIAAYAYGNLEGRKMSKGRGWYLSLKDFLDNFDADSLRYYWIASSPLTEDADFNWFEFGKRYNTELADVLGNFIHRVLSFIKRFFDSKVPVADTYNEEDKKILNLITDTWRKVGESIENFEFRSGLLAIMELARAGNKYFNDQEPWVMVKKNLNRAKTALHVCARIVKALAILLEPYMPFTAEKIWSMLNLARDVHSQDWTSAIGDLPENHIINDPKPIFTKVEEKTLDSLRNKLCEKIGKKYKVKGVELVDVAYFSKFTLKVGEILSARKTDDGKLELEVSIGENQIIKLLTNLGEFPESKLKGEKVVVVLNIEDADGNATILKVNVDNKSIPVTVDKDVQPGSKIE
ncbi:MAG: methionine--tRNA ligase [Candidatus Odinarchaeia archaeon]